MSNDNLTLRIKEDLASRGIVATDREIRSILSQKNLQESRTAPAQPTMPAQTLWDIAGQQTSMDPMSDYGLDYESSALSILGKGLWSALDVATLGGAGLGVRSLGGQESFEALQPKTFGERAAAGVGGVAGFIPTFGVARAGVASVLKGATFLKGGKTVGYGAAAAGKKFTDDAIKLLESDKNFKKWWGSTPRDKTLSQWIKDTELLTAPKNAIVGAGSKIMSSHSMRVKYAERLEKNIPNIIRGKIDEISKQVKLAGEDFAISNKTVRMIEDEVKKYVGGKYNFPITTLHEYLALKWGNTKLATIAAAAAEEAILFSAVELPMNYINSLANEDPNYDFSASKTLTHSILLGSALGLIRPIGGGADMPIISSLVSRLRQNMNKRRKWSRYNINEPSDRIDLARHAETLWESNSEIFGNLRIKDRGIVESVERAVGRDDLKTFAKDPANAKILKDFLVSVENNMLKKWFPEFARQAGRDLYESTPRILLGTIAFNSTLYKDYYEGNMPVEDVVFHTLLGAVMSKRGKDLEWKDKKGNTHLVPENRRPFIYEKNFEKTNDFLNTLGMDVDHAAFKSMINNAELIKNYGTADKDHPDMQILSKLAEQNKLVVDKDTESEIRNKRQSDELYDTFQAVVEAGVGENKRVLNLAELSEKQLKKLFKNLQETEFETLNKYRSAELSKGIGRGVNNWSDVLDILAEASGKDLQKQLKVYMDSIVHAYNRMYQLEAIAEGKDRNDYERAQIVDGKVINLRPIAWDSNVISAQPQRVEFLFGNGTLKNNSSSVLGILRNRSEMSSKGNIKITNEILLDLFGERNTSNRGEMDQFDRSITRLVFGKESLVEDNLVLIGDTFQIDAIKNNMFIEGIRNTHRELEFIRDIDKSKSIFGEDVDVLQEIIERSFLKDKQLAQDVQVVDAGKKPVEAESREQIFASNLLSILRKDPKRATLRTELVGRSRAQASLADITKIMEEFRNKKLMQGFTGSEEEIMSFVSQLKNYTQRKGLANASRADGTPLRGTDLAIMSVLADGKLMGKNYDIVNVEAELNNIKDSLMKSDLINKKSKQGIGKDFANWASTNQNQIYKWIKTLNTGKDPLDDAGMKLYNLLIETAEKIGGGKGSELEQSAAQLVSNWANAYETYITPLLRDAANKGGILKRGIDLAAVTPDYLARLVSQFDAIKKNVIELTHNELVEEIARIHTSSESYREFMGLAMNAVLDKRGNVTRVIEILKEKGLYRKGKFDLNDQDKTLNDRIKEAAYEIQISTQPYTTDRAIDLLTERNRQDFNAKQHSDTHISITLDTMKDKWGLLLPEEYLANMNPGSTPAEMIRKVVSSEGKFTIDNLIKHLTKSMSHEVNGILYEGQNWIEMPSREKLEFVNDMIKLYSSFEEGKKVRNLKVGVGEAPLSKPESLRNNDLLKFLEDTFGEIVTIDPEFRDQEGLSWDIRMISGELQTKYYDSLKNVGQTVEARIAFDEVEARRLPQGMTQESGYITAWIGDLNYGIGIPIMRTGQGKPLGADKLATMFVKTLQSARERFQDRPEIQQLADSLIDRYVNPKNENSIVEVRRIDKDEKPVDYNFKFLLGEDTKTHADASLMMTVVFGDKVMGENFWDAALNSKRKSKGWGPEKELAHDVLRRIRLFANSSSTNLSTKRIKGLIDVIKTAGFDKDSRVMTIVNDLLEPISKSGMLSAHIIKDEGDIKNPSATSAYENFRQQIMGERDSSPKDKDNNPIYDIEGLESDFRFPGGLGDTSHFNSVVVISRRFLEALRLLSGDLHKESSAGKPVIAFANDGRSALVGKTMFMLDGNFEPYMKEHKVDMVMFGSAAKIVGKDYENSIIDLKDMTVDQLLSSRRTDFVDKEIGIPIDAIQMQSWHSSDKDARIPMQVGSDLTGTQSKSYFDWLMSDKVENYEQKLGEIVGSGNMNRLTALAKELFNGVGTDVDNAMYSTISRWLNANGYPMFLPFKNSMQNRFMRHYIDGSGMNSPVNAHGSQSVLVPSYYPFDHAQGLRNSSFYNDSGNRKIYTVGQIEIGQNNYSKPIGKNLSVVFHHPDRPDQLLNWTDFIKEIRKEVKEGLKDTTYIDSKSDLNKFLKLIEGNIEDLNILHNVNNPKLKNRAKIIGEVHKYLRELNDYMRPGSSVEIALVAHRTPSTRSSDKVIAGLKGFTEDGNYARLNTMDVWTRLEADHDIDKLNYWWDTPSDIRDAWADMAGNVTSVTDPTGKPKSSIEGLDLMNPESIVKYNFDSKRASYMRGQVVKARRMKQFLKHYQGYYKDKDGFSVLIMENNVEKRLVIDMDKIEELDRISAIDIQRIVDSKDGWTEGDFTKNYLKDILFGREDFVDSNGQKWEGIFIKQTLDSRDNKFYGSGKLRDVEQDIIYFGLQPYRNLLQLATDVYEGGEQKRVDYQSYMDGYRTYRDTMNRLNRYAYKRLSKKHGPQVAGEIFFQDRDPKKMRDIYGLEKAKMPPQGRREERGRWETTKDMLPFDRGIWATASIDRLSLDEPMRSHRLTEDKFNEFWERYIDSENATSNVVESVVKKIQNDAKSIAYLNVIDRQLSRAKRAERRAKRYRDTELEDWLSSRRSRLERVKKGISDRISLDDAASIEIRKTIREQIVRSLMRGKRVDLPTVSKIGDKVSYGRPQKVKLDQLTKNKRKLWIRKNSKRIQAALWDPKMSKFAIDIKGISSNDYAQIMVWHRVMASKTGMGLNPSEFTYAEAFESSVHEIRKQITTEWSSWFNNRDYAVNEREDIVQANINRIITKQYVDWESVNPGLGRLWIYKFMTPSPDGNTATYHRGNWLPGFNNIDKQIKYIRLGLNFLSTTDQISDTPLASRVAKGADLTRRQADQLYGERHLIFRDLAETFTDAMRVLYNQEPIKKLRNSAEKDIRERIENEILDASDGIEDFSLKNANDAIIEGSDIFKRIDESEARSIDDLSENVKLMYGVTGDVALDYLSLKGAPLGLDMLYDIKKLSEFYFMPKKVLNSQGKMRNIKSLKSYYGFVKRNSSVYFGTMNEKNLLHRKEIPLYDTDPYGGVLSRGVEDANTLIEIALNKHRKFNC